MSDSLSRIAVDMEEYEALCRRYGVPVKIKEDAHGNRRPDCYGRHAQSLRKRLERESKRKAVSQSRTRVVTLQPNQAMRSEWTAEGWASKKPGFRGRIIGHSDSHGLCYHVLHDDGSSAWYDPSELQVIR